MDSKAGFGFLARTALSIGFLVINAIKTDSEICLLLERGRLGKAVEAAVTSVLT